MFETKTTIRRRAIRKALAESRAKGREAGREEGLVLGREEGLVVGREEGRREFAERIRAMMLAHGIELSPEDEKEIFGSNGHRS